MVYNYRYLFSLQGTEILEAERVYILMKREYRISRNVRAEWFIKRINAIITFQRTEKLVSFNFYIFL